MIIKLLTNCFDIPKTIPTNVVEAIEKTCNYICERERMKREWNEVWAKKALSEKSPA